MGRDALLILGSLAYRYKTRRDGDAFFDPDSLDYKVTPSTLSKASKPAACVCGGGDVGWGVRWWGWGGVVNVGVGVGVLILVLVAADVVAVGVAASAASVPIMVLLLLSLLL